MFFKGCFGNPLFLNCISFYCWVRILNIFWIESFAIHILGIYFSPALYLSLCVLWCGLCAHVCRFRRTGGVLFCHSPPCSLETGSLTEPGAREVCSKAQWAFCFWLLPSPVLNLNSDPGVCAGNALTNGPISPVPPFLACTFLDGIFWSTQFKHNFLWGPL